MVSRFLEIRYFPENPAKPCRPHFPADVGDGAEAVYLGTQPAPARRAFSGQTSSPGPGGTAAAGGVRRLASRPWLMRRAADREGDRDAPGAPHAVPCPEVASVESWAVDVTGNAACFLGAHVPLFPLNADRRLQRARQLSLRLQHGPERHGRRRCGRPLRQLSPGAQPRPGSCVGAERGVRARRAGWGRLTGHRSAADTDVFVGSH